MHIIIFTIPEALVFNVYLLISIIIAQTKMCTTDAGMNE